MRDDLLQLTPDVLATLANRGLVKRAQREIAKGRSPTLEEVDNVVTGTFPDGVITRMAPETLLRETECSCGSVGVCRHRIAVALAYIDFAGGPEEPAVEAWTPAIFDDETLEARLGKAAIRRAKRALSGGLLVEVSRSDPPTARLPTCTVRFLVAGDLTYARCDCLLGESCEHIAQAVWAFREGDLTESDQSTTQVELSSATKEDNRDLGSLLTLTRTLLVEGVSHSGAEPGQHAAVVRKELESDALVWPLTLLDDLEDQVGSYHSRSARYRPGLAGDLVLEAELRARAIQAKNGPPRALVLGTSVKGETRLDHLRLTSIGARVTGGETEAAIQIFLADPDTATVLVLEKRWTEALSSQDLSRKSVTTGIKVRALAEGQVVTRSARRRANRQILLRTGRANTAVVGQRGDWEDLPEPIQIKDFDAHRTRVASRPPRWLRARVRAEDLHVIPVAEVAGVWWVPGEQAVVASLIHPSGEPFRLVSRFRGSAEGAMSALAEALTSPNVRFVSGLVHLRPDGLEVDPVGVVTDRLIVPDLAPREDFELEVGRSPMPLDPVGDAVAQGQGCLDDLVHVGLRSAAMSWQKRARSAAQLLQNVGMKASSAALDRCVIAVADTHGGGDMDPAVDAWLEAALRLSLAPTLRS